MQSTRSASSVSFCRWGVQSRRIEQDGRPPGGLPEGLGQVLDHSPLGILVKQRVMLHDQEAVVVLLQDGHELEDCEGAAHFPTGRFWVQSFILPTETNEEQKNY